MKVLSDFRRVYRIPHERAHRNHSDIRAEVVTDVLMEFPMNVLPEVRSNIRMGVYIDVLMEFPIKVLTDCGSDIRRKIPLTSSWNC